MFDFVFESAQVATPTTPEENIRRGREAMKHVIATGAKEYRAMYRKELGWIAFSWGTPGTPPPEFKNRKEAAEWWANLPGKTNGQKGSRVFAGGRGVSHILAKRDWEAKWMDRFAGQNGREVALKCVEVIAKGRIHAEGHKRSVIFGKWYVSLIPDSRWSESRKKRAQGKKKEESWILTGFEVVENDEEYGILESVDAVGSRAHHPHSMHPMPTVTRHEVGAADSVESAGEAGGGSIPACPTHAMPIFPRHGVGAANFVEFADAMGSRAHHPHSMHPMPTATRRGVGATDSVEKSVPDSSTPRKPWERKEPEYGTVAYGLLLDL